MSGYRLGRSRRATVSVGHLISDVRHPPCHVATRQYASVGWSGLALCDSTHSSGRRDGFRLEGDVALQDARSEVLIVGGGVIGLACGLALREAGRDVTVLDAGTAGCGSSHGNCGTITPSHALPLAAPGTIGRALRWMLTPDAPLYLRPRFDPSLWAWLARFAARCNHADWMRAAAAKVQLLEASRQALPEWVARHRLDCEFLPSGTVHVFRDARALDEFGEDLRALAEIGIASEHIGAAELLRAEPALRDGVVGAVRFPGDASLRPDRYVAGLARALREAGGQVVEHCAVESLDDRSWRRRRAHKPWRAARHRCAGRHRRVVAPVGARAVAGAGSAARRDAAGQGLFDHLRPTFAGAAPSAGAARAQRLRDDVGRRLPPRQHDGVFRFRRHAQPPPAGRARTRRPRIPARTARPEQARGMVRLAADDLRRPADHRPRPWHIALYGWRRATACSASA